MLSQGLQQKLEQKLSPQQIQFIKLLQVPTANLEARIEQELEENPALLEAGELDMEAQQDEDDWELADAEPTETAEASEEGVEDAYEHQEEALNGEGYEEMADFDESWGEDDYDYRLKLQTDPNQEEYNNPVVQRNTLYDSLIEQIGLLALDQRQETIAYNIIGNIEEDGYLRRDLFSLVDDIAFKFNMHVSAEEVEEVLAEVQHMDPPGVGARDLQECLILQISRMQQTPVTRLAERILMDCYEAFTKKHFDKIKHKLDIEDDELREAYDVIMHLNPKPGEGQIDYTTQSYIIPDFILTIEGEEINIALNSRNAPELEVNNRYKKMLRQLEHQTASKHKRETLQFVKEKIESAQWFIEAIRQRQMTLMKIMGCIVEKQRLFFLSDGDESQLRPMILKDIADEIEMDISTVSRVTNSKYVQTPFGIYPLKYFFSEGITKETGEEVSNREVKSLLKKMIGEEDKAKPLSDSKLAELLADKGYNIARRTVAKYREQLGQPVARMRKEL